MLVEVIVKAGDDEVAGYVKVTNELAEIVDALGGGQNAQAGDVIGTATDQELDGAAQRTAGGQHWVEDVALTAGEIFGETLSVGHRLEGFLIAGHAHEADFS